jgi:AcrR family transcriptional regulator
MRVRTEAKREAIVEVAAAVFGRMGFERSSMDQIAAEAGASKATVYGYFGSKQELFLAVIRDAAERRLGPAFLEFGQDNPDIAVPLRRFGIGLVSFLCSPEGLQYTRMIVAEAGQSEIGCVFFDSGPKKGDEALAAFLGGEMEAGRLRRAEPLVAARHCIALMAAELHWPMLYGATKRVTRDQIRRAVDNGVDVFLAAYALPRSPPTK